MKKPPSLDNPIKAIQQLAADLRDPEGGCPWDVKQDHKSMIKHLIEEAYEVIDAIEALDGSEQGYHELQKELGDLFFQVVFHAQLGSEKDRFNLDDIARSITEKLIFRHPHVYGDGRADNSDAVLKNWESLKRQEKPDKEESMLSGIPRHLPALLKSYRIGQKVARVNFDWPATKEGLEQLLAKIDEERGELRAELPPVPEKPTGVARERVKEEMGDYLFAICQLARHYDIDPEEALQAANDKFSKRFALAEKHFADQLARGEAPSLDEWEVQWQKAKSTL